jgi:hypothetical protein
VCLSKQRKSGHCLPLAIGNDFDAILKPFDVGIVLLNVDAEDAVVVFNAIFRLQFAGELVLEL